METKFKAAPDSRIVYIRPIAVDELPEVIREQVGEAEIVYSVHRPNGDRVALVADRALAFSLARMHDMAPVSVH